MPVLNRKLARDLRGNAGVLATVVAIIAVGTGSFISLNSAQRILLASQHDYYTRHQFADFWVDVKKAPLTAVASIANLPGVAEVESRIVFDVILDVPGEVRPLSGRLISTPERDFSRTINAIAIVRGSGFSPDRTEEAILGEAFAKAHGLGPGDRVSVILNRKKQAFVIVGTAMSPEYVYAVRGQGDFAPDPAHFATIYIKEGFARDVLDFQDACNQIVGRMVPGHQQDVDVLLERAERMLDPYGVLATTPRERQASHRFLSDEIKGLGVSALVMPSIFLGVAALVLNVLMSRLAERQRTVIGTLKALGYSDREVLGHYLSFGVAVGVAGGLAGIGLGLGMTVLFLRVYRMFFEFPEFLWRFNYDLLGLGMLISIAFSILGTLKGVWHVLQLHPAEAMRPRPPERGGSVFLERFPVLWRRLGFRSHIALRSLSRNRGRTLTGVLSSAMATSIILASLVMRDSIWFLLDFQFEHVTHSDADLGMRDEKSEAALLEARALPGVDEAEPMLALTCDIRHGRFSRRLGITGLAADHRLTTPVDANLQPIEIPPEGIVLSRKVAEILDARAGDRLEITPVRGQRLTTTAHVQTIVESYLGLECYADLRYLSRIAGESFAMNAVQTRVNPARRDDLYRTLKELPNAQNLAVPATTMANIKATFIKSMSFSLTVMIGFAGVIGFGSMLNASLIEIADRTRDIASFRVLGYRPVQISGIFFRQMMIIHTFGLIGSLPITGFILWLWAGAYDTEMFRIPITVRPFTVVLAAAAATVFVLLSQWFAYRSIRQLDWLEGIQVKE